MFCYTFWREHCLGKDFLDAPKTRSMRLLRRRRSRLLLKNCAKATLPSSKSSWNTAVPLNSSRSPITNSALVYLRIVFPETTLILRWWTTPGSRTDFLKIKKVWRPRCWESLERNPLKMNLLAKLEPHSPLMQTLVLTERLPNNSSREEVSLRNLPNRCLTIEESLNRK